MGEFPDSKRSPGYENTDGTGVKALYLCAAICVHNNEAIYVMDTLSWTPNKLF